MYIHFQRKYTAFPLLVGTYLGLLLYGFVLWNFGAATRFRQMFIWAFLMSGVGWFRHRCSV